jgi:hypothetical protein
MSSNPPVVVSPLELLERLEEQVARVTSYRRAPEWFDVARNPHQLTPDTFVVAGVPANGDTTRDATNIRLVWQIDVSWGKVVNPNDQIGTRQAILEKAATLIRALVTDGALPGVSIRWVSGPRLTVDGQQAIATVTFKATHTWRWPGDLEGRT